MNFKILYKAFSSTSMFYFIVLNTVVDGFHNICFQFCCCFFLDVFTLKEKQRLC